MTAENQTERFTLDVLPESKIAVFRWFGPITVKDRMQNVQRMVEFCKEHGIRNLIVDGRDQVSKTHTIDAFEFGQSVPLKMKGLRIAVVHRPDDDSLKFIETVAHNRGAVTFPCIEMKEARDWLDSFED